MYACHSALCWAAKARKGNSKKNFLLSLTLQFILSLRKLECDGHLRVGVWPVVDGDVEHGGAVVAVAVVVPVVLLHWHGAQRDPPPLLLLPLEVAVVELEVLRLHRLRQRQLLGVTDL